MANEGMSAETIVVEHRKAIHHAEHAHEHRQIDLETHYKMIDDADKKALESFINLFEQTARCLLPRITSDTVEDAHAYKKETLTAIAQAGERMRGEK